MTNDPRRFTRSTRTLMQLIAGGGLAAVVAAASEMVRENPLALALVGLVATYAVSYAQNWLEDHAWLTDRRA